MKQVGLRVRQELPAVKRMDLDIEYSQVDCWESGVYPGRSWEAARMARRAVAATAGAAGGVETGPSLSPEQPEGQGFLAFFISLRSCQSNLSSTMSEKWDLSSKVSDRIVGTALSLSQDPGFSS